MPSAVWPSNSWMTSPAKLLPVAMRTVRLVSLVLAPFPITPVFGETSSVTDTMAGAVGAFDRLKTWAVMP